MDNSDIVQVTRKNLLLFGWKRENNQLVPKYMYKPPIPEEVRHISSFVCIEKNCSNLKCVCKKEGVFCTTECKCKMLCVNKEREVVDVVDDDMEEDDYVV